MRVFDGADGAEGVFGAVGLAEFTVSVEFSIALTFHCQGHDRFLRKILSLEFAGLLA